MLLSSLKHKRKEILTHIYVDSELNFIQPLYVNFVNVLVDITYWLVPGWDLNGSNHHFSNNLLLKAWRFFFYYFIESV